MKVQDDNLFIISHASEEVIATSFAVDSGVRKGGRCGVQKTEAWRKTALDRPVRTSGAL
jgi:hypothetical protein